MTKLNPCPNCGSEPDIFEYGEKHSHIYCTECGDPTEVMSFSVSGAINAWNAATGEQPEKTLRDEFAAIALPLVWHTSSYSTPLCDVAALTYKMADAMLKERSR